MDRQTQNSNENMNILSQYSVIYPLDQTFIPSINNIAYTVQPSQSSSLKASSQRNLTLYCKKHIHKQINQQVSLWKISHFYYTQQPQQDDSPQVIRLYTLMGELLQMLVIRQIYKQQNWREKLSQFIITHSRKIQLILRILIKRQQQIHSSLGKQQQLDQILNQLTTIINEIYKEQLVNTSKSNGEYPLLTDIVQCSTQQKLRLVLLTKLALLFDYDAQNRMIKSRKSCRMSTNLSDDKITSKMIDLDDEQMYSDQSFNPRLRKQKLKIKEKKNKCIHKLLNKQFIMQMKSRMYGIKNIQIKQKLIKSINQQLLYQQKQSMKSQIKETESQHLQNEFKKKQIQTRQNEQQFNHRDTVMQNTCQSTKETKTKASIQQSENTMQIKFVGTPGRTICQYKPNKQQQKYQCTKQQQQVKSLSTSSSTKNGKYMQIYEIQD